MPRLGPATSPSSLPQALPFRAGGRFLFQTEPLDVLGPLMGHLTLACAEQDQIISDRAAEALRAFHKFILLQRGKSRWGGPGPSSHRGPGEEPHRLTRTPLLEEGAANSSEAGAGEQPRPLCTLETGLRPPWPVPSSPRNGEPDTELSSMPLPAVPSSPLFLPLTVSFPSCPGSPEALQDPELWVVYGSVSTSWPKEPTDAGTVTSSSLAGGLGWAAGGRLGRLGRAGASAIAGGRGGRGDGTASH